MSSTLIFVGYPEDSKSSIIKALLWLPRFCSASFMFAEARTEDGFDAVWRKKSASLLNRMRGSNDSILKMIAGITDSPLCRACMEEEETASHVILTCPGVAEYRAKHLGTPGSLPEAVGNVKGLLGFLVELDWHE